MLGEQWIGLVYVIREWLELENGWTGADGFLSGTFLYMFATLLIVVIKAIFACLPDTELFFGKGNIHYVYLDDEERTGGNCLCYDMTYF